MITGNRGEWSEIYTFMRLLGDGRIYAADENLCRIETMYFPIIKIIREEIKNSKYEYLTGNKIQIFYNDNLIKEVNSSEFASEANTVFEEIIRNNGTFGIESAEDFMHSIYVNKLAAPAQDKSDITMKLHDIQTGYENIVGFSIKSELGNPPTLLNAGKTTNFIYEIIHPNLNINRINNISTKQKIKDRLEEICSHCQRIDFFRVDNEIFNDNLQMIDSQMPKMLSYLLKFYYVEGISNCLELLNKLIASNPLNKSAQFYSYKMKEFLCAVALGMKPATVWDGRDEATGGYIVVKADGDVLAYHIYNRDSFKEYLLRNTRLETASSSRHEFGSLYEMDGRVYIKLNLQIRFK